MSGRIGWQSLTEWAFGFALVGLATIAAMTIGIFVLPFAAAALAVAGVRNRAWPEAPMGGLVGVGVTCLFVAYRNRGYSPCPTGPMRLARDEHFSCGGFDPAPWLIVGMLLIATGILGYLASRRGCLRPRIDRSHTQRCDLHAETTQLMMVNPPLEPPNLGFTMLLKIEPKL